MPQFLLYSSQLHWRTQTPKHQRSQKQFLSMAQVQSFPLLVCQPYTEEENTLSWHCLTSLSPNASVQCWCPLPPERAKGSPRPSLGPTRHDCNYSLHPAPAIHSFSCGTFNLSIQGFLQSLPGLVKRPWLPAVYFPFQPPWFLCRTPSPPHSFR